MGKYADLTGEVFGMLTVIENAGKNKWNNMIWDCQCACGNFKSITTGNLTGKNPTKSCGCLNRKKAPKEDLSGQKFGRITIISYAQKSHWNCVCDCGNELSVRGADLKSGNTKSCGCLQKEKKTTHGLSKHVLYGTRKDMISRCYNTKCNFFKWYGARGIQVCKEWRDSMSAFYEWAIDNGWEKGLTLDRIDNDGDYTPENCQFIKNEINCKKTRLLSIKNTSGYRGVSFSKRGNYYQSYYQWEGQLNYLGVFKTAKQAAIIRDQAIIDACINLPLNFPRLREI